MVSPTEVIVNNNNQGEVIMSSQSEGNSGAGPTSLAHDECGNVRVGIFFPDYNIQKCFTFDPDDNIWEAKKLVLDEVGDQIHDPINYGFYLPPVNGRAGKFLDEERPLDDYKLPGPVGQLEFKYKKRVYRQLHLNHKRLNTLHNKNTLKHFFDSVKCRNVERVCKYLERGIDPNFIDSDTGETPLCIATKVENCRSVLLQLVSGGAHIDYRNKLSLTAVHMAAVNGNAEAIKTLLELGASPNYKDRKGLTPLYHLSKRRNAPALCAELLLRDYAQLGCKDDVGNTELHQACKVGNYKVAEMLIFYGAELDYQTTTGATPLHICAANNERECLQTLLVRGADKQMLNNARQSPYDVANISGHKKAAAILEQHDDLLVVPFEESPTYNLNRRLAGANLEAMRLLSKSDPRINLSTSVMNLSLNPSEASGSASTRADTLIKSELGHLGLFDSLSVSRSVLRRSTSVKSGSSVPVSQIPNSLPGRVFICSKDYHNTSPGQLHLNKGDFVTVLSVGEGGLWEGKSGDKEGWFPSENVSEVKRHSSGQRSINEGVESSKLQQGYSTSFPQDPYRNEGVRTVVLAKTKKGYGFVLRGARGEQLKKLNVQFVPSAKMPALQYLDSIEKGSVSDKAGLRAGDFILEIDGINVVHASHEQTVKIIQKAGEVLAMKVVRAVLPHENGTAPNGRLDGTQTLPNRRSKMSDTGSENSYDSSLKKADSQSQTSGGGGGGSRDEEALAIEQLDATLASYDSDSKSSGSGVQVATREQKVASIRQRPSSSHFTSIQELDDMFSSPTISEPQSKDLSLPPSLSKDETRKPAKSRVKKFWNKGKSSSKLSAKKSLSLSQPNLAALDPSAEIKPITMYEMRVGHSVDAEGLPSNSNIPRTLSGDLSSLRRKSTTDISSPDMPNVPPPPSYPAPVIPDDRLSQSSSGTAGGGQESSFKPGSIAQTNHVSGGHLQQHPATSENKRYLPRTPLPNSSSAQNINSSPTINATSTFTSQSNTLQRGKIPPPPPLRSSSHESGVLLTMQAGTQAQHSADTAHTPPQSSTNNDTSSTPAPNAFANAIKKAAAERETNGTDVIDRPSSSNAAAATTTIGDELYAAVQKRQMRSTNGKAIPEASSQADNRPAVTSPPIPNGGATVEDQIRLAVAKRRTLLERRDTTESERSASVTPENTIAARSQPPIDVSNKPTALTKSPSESTNFRELAEQKRQEFLRKKSESEIIKSPVQPTNSNSSDKNGISDELQKVMNRLSVTKSDEPNNNSNKKKPTPPAVMKKPTKSVVSPTASASSDSLPPVEEFPPPPPPIDFGSSAADIIVPPPTFSLEPPSQFSPPPFSPKSDQSRHDPDNHSVSSSVGSDTISSVSQDGNRFSVATSGYSSDPSRVPHNHKLPFSDKNVELWSCAEVGDWLDSIGLGEYKQVFSDNCIEGETLVSMSKADIKELGVEKVGHRVKLDKEIRKLTPDTTA